MTVARRYLICAASSAEHDYRRGNDDERTAVARRPASRFGVAVTAGIARPAECRFAAIDRFAAEALVMSNSRVDLSRI
jgi:hypothetical protein